MVRSWLCRIAVLIISTACEICTRELLLSIVSYFSIILSSKISLSLWSKRIHPFSSSFSSCSVPCGIPPFLPFRRFVSCFRRYSAVSCPIPAVFCFVSCPRGIPRVYYFPFNPLCYYADMGRFLIYRYRSVNSGGRSAGSSCPAPRKACTTSG